MAIANKLILLKINEKIHLWKYRGSILKDPVLTIMHCAPAIIGGHFLDVENRKISVGL